MDEHATISIFEAPLGSHLYRQALTLREQILRKPLGLPVSQEELADDAIRQHFCAVAFGAVIGTVSLRPLDEATLHLKQMAVSTTERNSHVGAQLVAHAEAWGAGAGFNLMIAHARVGAEGFYFKLGYVQEGDPFEEQTIPHVRVIKQLCKET